jgi:hypothetical protein
MAPRIEKKSLGQQIAEQQDWIAAHGGDLIGYVARYGSKDDAQHYGDGGELIYAADLAALRRLEGARR